ncbi:TrbI/VirB10 family protein [Paraburkholderia rhizosphaerae]|uniref:Type IV secretion system protein VirB10 n=1 Tax=Paraburkholderia rhizosphaerae TaxID=480658 RepID=A0A4R8LPN5_9BURK|nr:TrbI/VirB10 family protein [Paraburkholderia rhizosphaerae]TDY48262.1 type IV secretion system protein VirB10 [Paraburkholderia rhizosphaerae]
MARQASQPSGDQAAIVKGKSPRNALIGVGFVAAVLIGGIGIYYQIKASNQAQEEARQHKKDKAAEAVDRTPTTEDVDKIIADQQARARREAAERAASAPEATRERERGKPGLTVDSFMQDQHTSELARSAEAVNVYASPIFPVGMRVKEPVVAQSALPPGILTPQQMAAQQAAAQQAAQGSFGAQAAGALAALGQPAARSSTTQERDTRFMKDVQDQSENGRDFARTGFVGQARGCVLSPPHHIPVLSIEGLNSDRPGTASLLVEQDVYDSLHGDCLMIPKGSTIVAPYSADIQPGQESILVAATELRLPNGRHVPLYGGQGADADGTAGFSGDVNNHFWKIYGTSFLTAILLHRFDGGDQATTTGPLGVTQVGSTAGQVAGNTAQAVLNRYQNIPPTISDDPADRHFMIKVNRDIYMEPYRDD